MTETPRPHASLGASTADRWTACPGSVELIGALPAPPPPSPYALEGTAMHVAAELWLRSGRAPDWATYNWSGITVDVDCIEAVESYVAVIAEDQAKYGGKLIVEKQFSLEKLHANMWGTNDALLAWCNDGVLRVYDFKGGKGITVEVIGNKQLMYYGLGALVNLPDLKCNRVELVIVQPRARHPAGPVRRWSLDTLELFDFAVTLVAAAKATEHPGAELHAGPWCRWCPVAPWCVEFKTAAMKQAQVDFADPPKPLPDPRLLTLAEIGALMPKFEMLENWMALVRECAHAAAESGREVPGWKLVGKRGRRQWIGTDAEIAAALKTLGMTPAQMFETALRSPAQIEKLLPKAQRDQIKNLATMISSGSVLAPVDDPRPSVAAQGAMAFPALPPGDGTALPPALQ